MNYDRVTERHFHLLGTTLQQVTLEFERHYTKRIPLTTWTTHWLCTNNFDWDIIIRVNYGHGHYHDYEDLINQLIAWCLFSPKPLHKALAEHIKTLVFIKKIFKNILPLLDILVLINEKKYANHTTSSSIHSFHSKLPGECLRSSSNKWRVMT